MIKNLRRGQKGGGRTPWTPPPESAHEYRFSKPSSIRLLLGRVYYGQMAPLQSLFGNGYRGSFLQYAGKQIYLKMISTRPKGGGSKGSRPPPPTTNKKKNYRGRNIHFQFVQQKRGTLDNIFLRLFDEIHV